MHPVGGGDLIDRLLALDGGPCDFRFEVRRIVVSLPRHASSLDDSCWDSEYTTLTAGLIFGEYYSCHQRKTCVVTLHISRPSLFRSAVSLIGGEIAIEGPAGNTKALADTLHRGCPGFVQLERH